MDVRNWSGRQATEGIETKDLDGDEPLLKQGVIDDQGALAARTIDSKRSPQRISKRLTIREGRMLTKSTRSEESTSRDGPNSSFDKTDGYAKESPSSAGTRHGSAREKSHKVDGMQSNSDRSFGVQGVAGETNDEWTVSGIQTNRGDSSGIQGGCSAEVYAMSQNGGGARARRS